SRRQSGSVSTTDTLPTIMVPIDEKTLQSPKKDFGFLPIPRRIRHDPDNPTTFGLGMNVIFGVASAFFVANMYYSHPLLIQLAEDFGTTYHTVSIIPTLLQAGYAVGLVLVCPLGDLVRRRQLNLLLTFVAASLTIGLAVTSNFSVFAALSFLIGFCSVVPQILMPLAVDLSPPHRRASCLSIVLSGLILGVLLARVFSGIIAQFITWRAVFWIAVGVQYVLCLVLYFVLPDYPAKNKGQTYFGILKSMAKYAVTEPLLVQAIAINLPSSACFTNWWVTLTFLLGGPPYNYPTVTIGLFGLIGMIGMVAAPFIGRGIDKLVTWYATLVGMVLLLLIFILQTAAVGYNVAVVVIICIGIDIFRQLQTVSLTSAVLSIDANARSRLNAVLILSLFLGQVTGTAVGSKVFTQYGWRADAALNVGWTFLTVIVQLLRGPHVPRYTWFGWKGGCYPIRKPKP
ncbi:MFS general substrate transporter, partial [Lentinus tigrinus ALCF2SS1-7]